ncbi:MAG: alkaline ceramidase [Opitutaceae bacterium]|nr:alkaline ceramidase [Opitutaceae bacterium]
MTDRLQQRFPALRSRVGVSRWDITPSFEVAARNWGAAKHIFATSVHRPLTGTAMALSSIEAEAPVLLLISLDLGWWLRHSDAEALRERILRELELPEANVIIHLTHTHAGPVLDSDAPPESNPQTGRDYLEQLSHSCVQGGREAIANQEAATTLFRTGRCGLATERDLIDPDKPDRYITGFNPSAPADDTLLTALSLSEEGKALATLINYACHPTTLAWDNTAISPDFPGAMRELIESETSQSPCLFLQGASGELAPAEQYSGDTALADRHGRELGYAALSTLGPMITGHTHLRYDGVVESGAPLAQWQACAQPASSTLRAVAIPIELPLKSDLLTIADIKQALEKEEDGFQKARLMRARRVRQSVGDGPNFRAKLWLWRLGDAVICALPFEAYSIFQIELRVAFPDVPLFVLNISNGHIGYIPPAQLYDHDLYTVWQTPLARGAHEQIFAAAVTGIRELYNPKS